MMASPKERGPGKNKRKWKDEEDDALLEVVKDLVISGTYKADNGFKPGFLNAVEVALKEKLPDCALKAQPHINSRLRHFKSTYAIVHDMVVGQAASGFGWDSEKKMVTAEKAVWTSYIVGHPKASEYRNKPCRFYDDLCVIFGKDRASGNESKGPQDLEDDVNEEPENEELSEAGAESSSAQGATDRANSSVGASSRRGKRNKTGDILFRGLSEVASVLGADIRAASSELCRAINDAEMSEKRSQINEELTKLNLATMDRFRATRMIASDRETLDIFFSISDEEKKEWVTAILKGDI